MADGHIKIVTAIDNSMAVEEFKEFEEAIEKYAGKSEKKLNNKLEKMRHDFDKLVNKMKQVQSDIKQYEDMIEVSQHNLWRHDQGIEVLDAKQIKQATNDLIYAKKQLDGLNVSANETAFSMQRMRNLASEHTDKLEQGSTKANKLSGNLKNASKSAHGLDVNIGKGVKKLGRYALAMFSIRSAYTLISRLARGVINSNDEMGQKLKAQVEGITNAVTNLLAPAVKFVVDMVSTLVGYLAGALKIMFGIDILAKKTGKNLAGGVAKANKEMKKFLAGFDEIEKLTSDTNDDSGGANQLDPGIQIPNDSLFIRTIENMKKALEPFLNTIKSIDFEPLEKSVTSLGKAFKNVIDIISNSFANIMNNSVGPFIKLMAEDIVPRALLAGSNALDDLAPYFEWFLTEIIEPFIDWYLMDFAPVWFDFLITAFNGLLVAVEETLKGMQDFWEFIKPLVSWLGDNLLEAIDGVSEAIAEWTGNTKDNDGEQKNLFRSLGFVLGAFLLVKGAILILSPIIIAITTVVKALVGIFSFLLPIIKAVATFFAGAFSGSILAIIALVSLLVIALVGLVTNTEQIGDDIFEIIQNIIGFFKGLIDFVVGIFTGDWKKAFKGLAEAVGNAFAGLVNTVKLPINIIIDGLNAFIRGINKIKIPSWVPGVGGKGINIGTIPRLQRGAVINRPMQALVGDGGREAVIPLENDTRALEEIAALLAGFIGATGSREVINVNISGRTLLEIMLDELKKAKMQNNGGLAYEF